MKRIATLLVSVLLLSVLGWVGVAQAGNVRTGENASVAASETIDGSFYIAGNNVKVAGTIKGDLFCAGQRVEITGTVEGDVICAGQVLSLKGKVLGDARVAGMTLTATADIAGSLTAAGQLVTLEKESRIGRDITMAGADVTINGFVGRDARVSAEVFAFDGISGRHIHVRDTQETKLGESAVVAGEFIYTSEHEAQIADGAQVAGKTERLAPEQPQPQEEESLASYIISAAFMFAGMVLVALSLVALAPKLLDTTATTLRRRHVWAFGLGLVIMIFAPLIALILFFTGIGMALGLLVLLGWVAMIFSASSFTAYTIGQLMAEKLQWKTTLPRLSNVSLGFLALFVLALIPFVNVLVLICAVIWGTGGLVITCIERLRTQPQAPAKTQSKQT